MVDSFSERGYQIVKSDGRQLDGLREALYEEAKSLVGESLPQTDYVGRRAQPEWFDQFHQSEIRGPELNKFRLSLQKRLQPAVGMALFKAFPVIAELVGPDVMHQRGCNLVVAQPGDTERAPTHRDAPMNSNFELVCWVPMNDCYGTKSMSILTQEQTDKALGLLKDEGYESYKEYAEIAGEPLEVPYGSACLFWAGLTHTIPVNQTNETRWTLNHRYKNYWAPYGLKGSSYFETLELSPLTRRGLKAEMA